MSQILIDKIAEEKQWARLNTQEGFRGFIDRPGEHVLFVPGEVARNLESADVAVILPELALQFQHRFDVAIVEDPIEKEVRAYFEVYKTPSLIFVRAGQFLGAIPKVRDWDDYIERTTQILNKTALEEA